MEEKFSRHASLSEDAVLSSGISRRAFRSIQEATSKTSLLSMELSEEMLMYFRPLLRAAHPTTKLVPFQLRGDQIPQRYWSVAPQPPVHGVPSHECLGEHALVRSPGGAFR